MAVLAGESGNLNRYIVRLLKLEQQVSTLQAQVAQLTQTAVSLGDTAALQLQNNILFTWDGTAGKISWVAGYVKDNAGKVYPIPAGERALTASTTYWAAWNPPQQVMAFSTSLSDFQGNSNNLVLFSFKTGSAIQSGTAGGGGSDPTGTGFTRSGYSNFA